MLSFTGNETIAPEELYSVAGETQKTAHCTAIFVAFVTLIL